MLTEPPAAFANAARAALGSRGLTLPNFFVVGAGRSGTTSLHHYLAGHPDVHVCAEKSPNFFVAQDPLPEWEGAHVRRMAAQWVTDRAAYEALFASAAGAPAVGEVSPVYLQSLAAPRRIARACPGARIVAILRDPVDRAYAHFLGRRRDGLEPRADFARVVEEELSRPLPDEVAFGSYLGCGRYHHFLAPYFEHFPRERVRVLLFDDLAADAAAVARELFSFLGVDPQHVPDTEHRHGRTGEIRNPLVRFAWTRSVGVRTAMRPYLTARVRDVARPAVLHDLERRPLDPALRARLADLFRDDVARLEDLIGRDLSHWL